MIDDDGNPVDIADDGGATMMASWTLLARIIVEMKHGGRSILLRHVLLVDKKRKLRSSSATYVH